MSATLAFTVTAEQLEAIRAAAAKNGIAIAGNAGTVSAHGCTVGYQYADGVLTLSVLSAPPFCTGMAAHKLHDLVESVIQPQTKE